MYGKIENNALLMAPKVLKFNGRVHYNPDDELYKTMGYLPVVNTPYPADGGHYVESWEVQDGEIVCVWLGSDEPPSRGMTAEERLCQAESELSALRHENEQLRAEVMYLCMMNDIEPMGVSV